MNLNYGLFADMCSMQNGGCQHQCVNSPSGPQCQCEKGFEMKNGQCQGKTTMIEKLIHCHEEVAHIKILSFDPVALVSIIVHTC